MSALAVGLDELRQTCSAPSDAYSAGVWCETANDAVTIALHYRDRCDALESALRDTIPYVNRARNRRNDPDNAPWRIETAEAVMAGIHAALGTPIAPTRDPRPDEQRLVDGLRNADAHQAKRDSR